MADPAALAAAGRRGLVAAGALVVLALVVQPLFGWQVQARAFAPLSAHWRPRFGPGTIPAALLGAACVRWAPRLAVRLRWSHLLLAAFVVGVAWLVVLATVDGWNGIGGVLGSKNEYLQTARAVTDVSSLLHHFIDRIPADSAGSWPTHVAGHPPGVLLFFVLLVRMGLGGGLAAGWVVLLLAATTPLAVLVTLRRLGAPLAARRVAPFLVVGPAAVWLAVSADAMFAAVGAWGLCCLAVAATGRGVLRTAAWGLAAGLLLGYCALLSYG
ncbi:MAG: hypothetical protein ACRDVG_08300, partial [Jatrophihabitantaceae bacterium]